MEFFWVRFQVPWKAFGFNIHVGAPNWLLNPKGFKVKTKLVQWILLVSMLRIEAHALPTFT